MIMVCLLLCAPIVRRMSDCSRHIHNLQWAALTRVEYFLPVPSVGQFRPALMAGGEFACSTHTHYICKLVVVVNSAIRPGGRGDFKRRAIWIGAGVGLSARVSMHRAQRSGCVHATMRSSTSTT
jgi:hypothetical protein